MLVAPRSTVKRSPVKDTSRKVHVGPFTSPDDFASRMIRVKDDEDSKEGFMFITLKKRQSFKSGTYLSPRRLKWSRELEKVPTLDTLSKGNSQAQVGGALSYTDTSHWYSSSTESTHSMIVSAFTDEEEGHFSLSESAGKLVGQQLQHGNVVWVGTNGNYKSSGESPERNKHIQAHSPAVREGPTEPVPLSIIDELEKRNAKILTPRSPSIYLSLPIVSETYPLVFHADYQHKPFTSAGFHSVGPGEPIHQIPGQRGGRKSKIYSSIVRIAQSGQDERLARGVKERLWAERYSRCQTYSESHPNTKRPGAHKVILRELSARGDIVKSKSANMEKILKQCHNASPSTARTAPVYKGPLVPVITSRQDCMSAANVGLVLNGVNPKHCPEDISTRSPDYFRGLPSTAGRKTNIHRHQTPSPSHKHPKDNQENKMDLLFITKPLNRNHQDINYFVCKQVCTKEERCSDQTLLPVRQATDTEGVVGHEVSFLPSKPSSSSEDKGLKEAPARRATPVHAQSPLPSCDIEIHSETSNISVPVKVCMRVSEAEGKGLNSGGAMKIAFSFDPHQAISIPTAESV